MIIKRKQETNAIENLLKVFPVVGILGARQCGKTTLARQFDYQPYFDLENPKDLARLDHPQMVLDKCEGLIVIDEIQRSPNLFELLRVLADSKLNQKFLILGSASRDFIKQSSESLAGRIGYHHLSGFSLEEVGSNQLDMLWFRGGYPRSFLAGSLEKSCLWLDNYIISFLERDISQLGIRIPSRTLHRFWSMLCHYHGRVINYADLGRSFGISDMTIRKYIDLLEGTFMIRVLQPWYPNMKKRLVKRPKIYMRDSGLFHRLMTMENFDQLMVHPKLGFSWEGLALECACKIIQKANQPVYFWRTHEGAEVDLFWQKGGKNRAIEFEYMDAPRKTKSMQSALNDLELAHLWIIYPGNTAYFIDEKISVLPLEKIADSESPFVV